MRYGHIAEEFAREEKKSGSRSMENMIFSQIDRLESFCPGLAAECSKVMGDVRCVGAFRPVGGFTRTPEQNARIGSYGYNEREMRCLFDGIDREFRTELHGRYKKESFPLPDRPVVRDAKGEVGFLHGMTYAKCGIANYITNRWEVVPSVGKFLTADDSDHKSLFSQYSVALSTQHEKYDVFQKYIDEVAREYQPVSLRREVECACDELREKYSKLYVVSTSDGWFVKFVLVHENFFGLSQFQPILMRRASLATPFSSMRKAQLVADLIPSDLKFEPDGPFSMDRGYDYRLSEGICKCEEINKIDFVVRKMSDIEDDSFFPSLFPTKEEEDAAREAARKLKEWDKEWKEESKRIKERWEKQDMEYKKKHKEEECKHDERVKKFRRKD